MDPALLELVRCPRCAGELRVRGEGKWKENECAGCGTTFPELEAGAGLPTVPCLFTEPTKMVADWRREVQRFAELVEHSRAAMDEQLARADLLPLTRARLERTREAHSRNGQ